MLEDHRSIFAERTLLEGRSMDSDCAQRIATIDEESSAGDEGAAEALERLRSGARVTAVECSDPHCEREVVALLTRIELERLCRDLTSSQALGGDQLGRGLGELGDRLGRAIDGEDVAPRPDALGDLTCRGSGTAPDLDYPETGAERQGIDDLCQPGGQRRPHPCAVPDP
jgi:hypothetical protein